MRDYREWHRQYDDPGSSLSWRLETVRGLIGRALDATEGPVQVLSLCAGDGRDVLGVLAGREDAARVAVTLVELDPGLAAAARERASAAGLVVDVRATDAGTTDAAVGAVPADVLLLVGIFGNISDDDIRATIAAAPSLCAPGAHVLWTRGTTIGGHDLTPTIRGWFAEAGFTELDFAVHDGDGHPSVGFARLDAEPAPYRSGQRLFTFLR